MPRPHLLPLPALAFGALAIVVATLPWIGIGGSAPPAHAALESIATLVPLLAGYVLLSRLRQAAGRDDLGAQSRVRMLEPAAAVVLAALLIGVGVALASLFDPSAERVSAMDLLRCGAYAALALGVAVEIRGYRSRLTEAAVRAERRRIARDLHDGVAQELAYIVGRAKSGRRPASTIAEIERVAERALDDSRRAIAALVAESDEPLEDALRSMLDETAARMGVSVELDLQEGVNVTPAVREALIRVSREALLNAARHGAAQSVRVRLTSSGETELEIVDDGTGFDPDAPSRDRTRFGLVSMRERTRLVGGELLVRSQPGRGTKVKVVLPR
ncbi:MAG TPA: sensor histidine kinase [Gaiellaceae bacterium]|nr:sensor histidine kinase [Gaiellaceae bacterium]